MKAASRQLTTGHWPNEDSELIQQARDGSLDAISTLYDIYMPFVYKRVWFAVPQEDVEDVTQEVFIALSKSIKKFRGDAKLSTWLHTLTKRKIADYYRKKNRRLDTGSLDSVDLESQILKQASRSDYDDTRGVETIHLRQSFRQLPDHYQEVILLRFVDGYKFKEIGLMLDKTTEATKSLFRRALSALRLQYGG